MQKPKHRTIGGHFGTTMPSEYFGNDSGRYTNDAQALAVVYTPGTIHNGIPITPPMVMGGAVTKPKASPKPKPNAKAAPKPKAGAKPKKVNASTTTTTTTTKKRGGGMSKGDVGNFVNKTVEKTTNLVNSISQRLSRKPI